MPFPSAPAVITDPADPSGPHMLLASCHPVVYRRCGHLFYPFNIWHGISGMETPGAHPSQRWVCPAESAELIYRWRQTCLMRHADVKKRTEGEGERNYVQYQQIKASGFTDTACHTSTGHTIYQARSQQNRCMSSEWVFTCRAQSGTPQMVC